MFYYLRFVLCLIMVLIGMTTCTTNPVSEKDAVIEFWFWNPDLREYAEQRMEQEKSKLHTIQDIKNLQGQFKNIWELGDFEPTIKIVFARDLIGNCKSAAVLGQWSLKQIDIESRFVNLYGNGVKPHRICMSIDNTIMITGNEVWKISPELWQNEVLSIFSFIPYTKIKE